MESVDFNKHKHYDASLKNSKIIELEKRISNLTEIVNNLIKENKKLSEVILKKNDVKSAIYIRNIFNTN